MSVRGRAYKAVSLDLLILFIGVLAGNVADDVYQDSGIAYEEGHPTAYGGVSGWNPLKSLEIMGKMALKYIEDLLKTERKWL